MTSPDWRSKLWILGTLGGVFLGAVLLIAAAAKALDPLGFEEQIRKQGLEVLFSGRALAILGVAVEVGLGVLLVLGVRRPWVLIPTALLVAFFLFLTGRDYWRAAHGYVNPDDLAGCGCFGSLVQRTPREAFWQDAFLLLPALGLTFAGRRREERFPRLRICAAAVAMGAAALFTVKSPDLPLDNLATRLRPGGRASQICSGSGAGRVCLSDLLLRAEQGPRLVVLMDLKDAGIRSTVERLNAYAQSGHGPDLAILAAVTPEESHTFAWRYGPAFEVIEAPAGFLRPLYRRLPRSFLLEDGEVTATWSGLPPLDPPAAAPRGPASVS